MERKCWKRIFGKCIDRLIWNSCWRRITDPICLLKNAGCSKSRNIAKAGLKGAQYLVDQSRRSLDVANGVLEGAKHAFRKSKIAFDVANAALSEAKKANRAGMQALSAVTQFGLGGVFDITELSFDVPLSAAGTGHFRVSAVVKTFGHYRRYWLSINLRNILPFVKAIGNKVIGGLKRFIF